MKNFIENRDNLKEKVVAYKDPAIYEGAFEDWEKIIGKEKHFIAGLVGDAGVGKSTFLHNFVERQKKVKSMKFDVWEVPGRKDLWDAFVLEFAKNINEAVYNKAKGKIDTGKAQGKVEESKKVVNSLKGLTLFGFGVEFDLTDLMQATPAKRISEYQKVFEEVLKNVKEKTIYITLEDIDRAGMEGLYFIETLKKFIDDVYMGDKRFVVLIPLLTKLYENKDNRYRFDKVCDKIEYHKKLKTNKYLVVKNFLEDTFVNEYNESMLEWTGYRDGIEKMALLMKDTPIRRIQHLIKDAEQIINTRQEFIDLGDRVNPGVMVFLLWFKEQDFIEIEKAQSTYTIRVENGERFSKCFIILHNTELNYYTETPNYIDEEVVSNICKMYNNYLHYEKYGKSGEVTGRVDPAGNLGSDISNKTDIITDYAHIWHNAHIEHNKSSNTDHRNLRFLEINKPYLSLLDKD